ncbi:MAG: alcohol dehydrogenase catalytic domain-containing protein [Candidatus Omnitrophota bacterium]|nr:alcohol dehydrogenase catalytic domain-containing protein [Candidatus Omnitrophota bacterium]
MYYKNDDLRIEEMATPLIGSEEILLRVWASGICGSDVMQWYRIHKVPLVLGHEVSGEIVEIGKAVTAYKNGDRVAVSHHVPCGNCHYCLNGHETVCEVLRKTNFFPGGFSEYIRVPEINLKQGIYILPESVSYEEATFIEPLACVLRGQRLAQINPYKSVLIIGCGIAGLLHIKLARAIAVKNLIATDIEDFRLRAAKSFGANLVFNANEYSPQELRKINSGYLADVVILCAGADSAVKCALESVERGGTVLIFSATNPGLKFEKNINDIFWRNEITLTSSYAGSPQDHSEALELIRTNKIVVKDMITHRLPLSETGLGFKLVEEARESLKVIIEPQK